MVWLWVGKAVGWFWLISSRNSASFGIIPQHPAGVLPKDTLRDRGLLWSLCSDLLPGRTWPQWDLTKATKCERTELELKAWAVAPLHVFTVHLGMCQNYHFLWKTPHFGCDNCRFQFFVCTPHGVVVELGILPHHGTTVLCASWGHNATDPWHHTARFGVIVLSAHLWPNAEWT